MLKNNSLSKTRAATNGNAKNRAVQNHTYRPKILWFRDKNTDCSLCAPSSDQSTTCPPQNGLPMELYDRTTRVAMKKTKTMKLKL
jgi:hypothetical protein